MSWNNLKWKFLFSGKNAFIQAFTVNKFLHSLLCNTQLANVPTSVLHPVASILSFKGDKIIRQIEIDYDLVEVKPYGVCFSFTKKSFHPNIIADDEIGVISPRALWATHIKKMLCHIQAYFWIACATACQKKVNSLLANIVSACTKRSFSSKNEEVMLLWRPRLFEEKLACTLWGG